MLRPIWLGSTVYVGLAMYKRLVLLIKLGCASGWRSFSSPCRSAESQATKHHEKRCNNKLQSFGNISELIALRLFGLMYRLFGCIEMPYRIFYVPHVRVCVCYEYTNKIITYETETDFEGGKWIPLNTYEFGRLFAALTFRTIHNCIWRR